MRQLTDVQKNKGRKIITALMILLFLLLCVFVYKFGKKVYVDYQSKSAYSDIMKHASKKKIDTVSKQAISDDTDDLPVAENALQIDWDAFSDSEIVCWFEFHDINYPVMQHRDNKYYLTHLPNGQYNPSGSIFLLAENDPMLQDKSSFLYGHNMGNYTMFGGLKRYTKQDSANEAFYLYFPDGTRRTYRFFSVNTVYQSSNAYTWSFADTQSFLDWQQARLDTSLINTNRKPDADFRFVTLSTCNGYEGTTQRLIITATEEKVERSQKPASWYATYYEKYESNRMKHQDIARERQQALQNDLENYRKDVWDKRLRNE